MMTNKNSFTPLIGFAIVFFGFLPFSLLAQIGPPADGPIDKQIRKEVIDSLNSILIDGYVEEVMAKKMMGKINAYHKSGKYDTINSGRQFAIALTKDLFAVSHDKHITVEYVKAIHRAQDEEKIERGKANQAAFMDAVNHGFDKVERLAGNVGLLELRTFSTLDKTAARIDAAMALLADTDALIIDLRYNQGGHAASVEYLASYLLDAGKPLLFITMQWRSSAGNQPVGVTRKVKGAGLAQQAWLYQALPGPRYSKKPVYILISEITASGAESLTYSLQAFKRATVVGTTSAGAANPGGTDQLTSHFEIFIPRGKPIHPITHTNWEGIGVKPDVASSFEDALRVAYIKALEEIEKSGTYAGPEPIKELIEHNKQQLELPSKK